MTRPNDTAADALAARYGRSSDARRWRGVAVIAVAALALLVWVVWAAFGQLKHHDVGGLVESFEVRSPHEVSVTVQITRTSNEAVRCTIAAIASDHSEVGQRIVRVPAGSSGTRTITTVVRTEREATAADVVDCS